MKLAVSAGKDQNKITNISSFKFLRPPEAVLSVSLTKSLQYKSRL
jgi:hypothetical protein